jgi:hypothetical protein
MERSNNEFFLIVFAPFLYHSLEKHHPNTAEYLPPQYRVPNVKESFYLSGCIVSRSSTHSS